MVLYCVMVYCCIVVYSCVYADSITVLCSCALGVITRYAMASYHICMLFNVIISNTFI